MSIDLSAVNWLAVAVAAFGTFLLGGIWYMALFAKAWQRAHGYTDEQIVEMRKNRPPAVFFGVMLVSYALMAGAFAVLLSMVGVTSPAAGALAGFLIWLGPVVAINLTAWVSSNKPFAAYAIDLGYQLAFLVFTGALLGAWR